jgi:hypothetical protein
VLIPATGELTPPRGQPQNLRPNTAGWAAGRRLQMDNLSIRLEKNYLIVCAE